MSETEALAKIAARLRWEAEAGLSAFRNLSVLGANEVAALRLEGVLVELGKLDSALERMGLDIANGRRTRIGEILQ